MTGPISTIDALFFVALVYVLKLIIDRHRHRPLPPGPKPLPLLGNLLDIPRKQSHITYAGWAEVYGDVISFSALGNTIVVVNSAKAARELLDPNVSVYSDRPVAPFAEM